MKRSPCGPVVFTSGTPDFTGANRMAFAYMLALRESGATVAAICGEEDASGSGSVIDELEKETILYVRFSGWNKLMDRSLLTKVRGFLRQHDTSAVISFLQMDVKIGGGAARAEGIPFVACAQNTVTFGGSALIRTIKAFAFSHTLRKCASRVFCCSQSVLKESREDLATMGAAGCALVEEKHGFQMSAVVFCRDINSLLKSNHELH